MRMRRVDFGARAARGSLVDTLLPVMHFGIQLDTFFAFSTRKP